MAGNSTIASLDNVQETQVQATTTAQSVAALALAATPSIVLPAQIREYGLANNDPTNAVFIGFSNLVSSTRYYRQIAPGGSHQIAANVGPFRKLWIVAAAGTPNVDVAVFS